jgi:hypothetical protein
MKKLTGNPRGDQEVSRVSLKMMENIGQFESLWLSLF